MIASAAADGYIDEKERQNIISRLESVNLSDEELEFIRKELASPLTIEEIAAQIKSPDLAREVYTVSLMAVHVDTEAERNHLRTLAEKLMLDQAIIDKIHGETGVGKQEK
jgi:uncharacterized membrane protein YebE (DUF533 family)